MPGCGDLVVDDVQNQLIEILADGDFHSGTVLGQHLNLGRAAICKRIARLKDDWGVCCDAVSGKGYRLSTPVSLLAEKDIRQTLSRDVSINSFLLSKSLRSTNAVLMDKSQANCGQVDICITEHQTAGRGRRGRQWQSPFAQNIYLSLGTMLEIPMQTLSGLSLAVGVSIARRLNDIGYQGLSLKWPNDILYQGAKLGGILVEVKGETEGPVRVVVGLGLNVVSFGLPEAIEDNRIAFLQQLNQGIECDRNLLAAHLIDAMTDTIINFPAQGLAECENHWGQFDAFQNQYVVLKNAASNMTGICKGINSEGAILLEINGVLQAFNGGELSLRAL